MKIIKSGKDPKNKEFYKKCSNCNTEFSYTSDDVKPDFRDGDYVVCPVCGQFIAHGHQPENVDRSKDC